MECASQEHRRAHSRRHVHPRFYWLTATENQLRELEAVVERYGWQVEATFTDEGISGPASTTSWKASPAATSTR